MLLPSILNPNNKELKEIQINELLETNKESEEFNLILTKEDTKEIIKVRGWALQSYGRIEIDMGVAKKLIEKFSSSPFITQEEYVLTLNNLQEIFYYMKNETEDRIGDDMVIDIIYDFYNNECGGDIEFLWEKIQVFSEKFRRENQKKNIY
ncbi:DUF6323 family protein [Oceanirhabdus sp. W0125-5]|uniref:DUF6323 family protein n=1 Tax=Oceanirhabdus sp. W0125-5 TaxID=2999116 RepID=UPI0022F31D50|nr:DUF6323 family protein [Oceanirhabdus sp. W0125-5]WBW97286.1 DUF6323 family protein [Oceanirhabdus sp. W0125-5]